MEKIDNIKYEVVDFETDCIELSINEEKILIKLYENVAPVTVKNFKKLVKEKFYTNLTFHRVIENFMIQGGDPLGNGMGGSKENIIGEFLSNGFKNDLSHKIGIISMARSNDKNSASSQFFICTGDASFLDGDYASFGEVISGINYVMKINSVKTDRGDKPLEDVIINSIMFVEVK